MRWVNDQAFDPDKMIDAFGNVPGELIDYGAKALKPVENYIGSYLTLWDNLDDPRIVQSWHAMNTWVTELIPMAGATYRQLIQELYRENRLIQGKLIIRGEQVDLSRIRANLLSDDHRDLAQVEAFLRERDIDYVTYQDWKILDQYEVACGARQGRPRVKVTTVPEMMAIIRQGR